MPRCLLAAAAVAALLAAGCAHPPPPARPASALVLEPADLPGAWDLKVSEPRNATQPGARDEWVTSLFPSAGSDASQFLECDAYTFDTAEHAHADFLGAANRSGGAARPAPWGDEGATWQAGPTSFDLALRRGAARWLVVTSEQGQPGDVGLDAVARILVAKADAP